jgi:hypothetical protein
MLGKRIVTFDWLRGLAVVFMIQCHALVLLLESTRTEPLFKWLVKLDGLVAPSFIFSAGFSLALVQARGAASGGRWSRVKKTGRRLFEVLAVATLVNWMWFPVFRQPKWLWRLDILHCIGLSLLLALPLLAWLAPKPRVLSGVSLALALAVFGVSPLLEKSAGGWDWMLNQTTGAVFPLLPWAGYVYLGASAGAVAAQGDLSKLVRWLLLIGAIGAAIWQAADFFRDLYPAHNFWVTNPANAAQRWTIVIGLVLAFLAAPLRFLAAFGGTSMAAYFFHEALLYKGFFGYSSFDSHFHQSAGWPLYFALTALLIAMTFGLVVVTDKLYRKLDAKLSAPKATPEPEAQGAQASTS